MSPPGGWQIPPTYSLHAREQMAERNPPISKETVDLVCVTCRDSGEPDPDNDSYKLTTDVEAGRLQVAVTAESYLSGDRLHVKTAYWMRSPRRRRR
jgi:hypothetical protein